jgi:hypothetical protein
VGIRTVYAKFSKPQDCVAFPKWASMAAARASESKLTPNLGAPQSRFWDPGRRYPHAAASPQRGRNTVAPSRKTGDIGAAARLSPPGTLWVRA